MKKLGLLFGASAAMIIATSGVVASQLTALPERDASIIVEVDHKLEGLSEKGIKNTQDAVYSNIKSATPNVKRVRSYSVLNNAFLMEVNSKDIETIKTVPGVKSVTVDKMHWQQVINNDEYVTLDEGDPEPDYDETKNISAETMKKPDDTNDGEGTLVAILDNEFHFRGKTSTAAEWHHEVYDPLPEGTKVRYTFNAIRTITGMNAKARQFGKVAGDEGSEYLNSKVPFYFDYGGLSKKYGKPGPTQYDVHSELSYHGSHVSSITAANAPTYKGIAPKAQLALMKVFTDYDAKGMGEKIGLSNSTGAYDSVILMALEDCITLKVDGINMSLGSDLDDFDSDSITLKTLTRLNKSGILTSISAGNSGKTSFGSTGAYANWSTDTIETGIMSSYANNAASMTIASGHPTQVFYENAFVINNQNIAFEDQVVNREGLDDDYDREYRMKEIFNGGSKDWVYVPGFGTSADYAGLDVTGKIAVVNRGSTSFSNKYQTAEDKGAIGLIIINNDPTASDFNFRCSFGDVQPKMPIALVLFKNKEVFSEAKSGSFAIINKQVSDNPNKYTISTFSTDGATFDLDLKPEITAPGDNIKGAVPEHAMTSLTREEKEAVKYKAYQYLSGTSMSAPNYAGAQSVVLSKDAVRHIDELDAIKNNTELSAAEKTAATDAENAKYNAYKNTVNMRLMSTADPMKDAVENPETNVKSITSPRIQGAGMVDLEGALSTDVYLEGLDLQGEPIGKSKIALRNNADIAKGDIKLSFLAHNESEEQRSYTVKLTVMRPALATPNDIVTKEYNFKGEIESIDAFTGMSYYDTDIGQMTVASGTSQYKDVYKVARDIQYPATVEAGEQYKEYIETNPTKARELFTTIKAGYYYNAAKDGGVSWEPLPSYTAQSTKDVLIDEVVGQVVTLQPGQNTVTINPYSLSAEAKKTILDNYEFGCMIEGFVTLTSNDNHTDLSIPYLGFYSGSDVNTEASYETAPVAEPFNFEKDVTKVYPSDLVNDITKSLVGKDKVNFESMIVAGYAEYPQKIDTDKVLTNDQSFDRLTGFYKVGTDPLNDEYVDNPSDNIYVGSEATNTLIIQQFMLRSVAENYFTITNKATHEEVYASALQDMLFGDTGGKWALYKSHVDARYLSAGYVAHRAYAIVPLFDLTSGEAFPSGEYELQFNYQLAATKNWVSKSYTIHIDNVAPEFKEFTQYYDAEGVARIRAYIKEDKLSSAVVGYNRVDTQFDAQKGLYYFDVTKEFLDNSIAEMSEGGNKRLFVGATDFARGSIGCIVHANDENDYLNGVTTVQGSGIGVDLDFTYENGVLKFFNNEGEEVEVKGKILLNNYAVADHVVPNSGKKGCKSSLVATSFMICIPSLMGAALLFTKKKKGGRK